MGDYYKPAAPRRPAATTWQEDEENRSRDAWEAQGASVGQDAADARRRRGETGAAAGSAYEAYGAMGDPNVAGWSPINTRGANSNNVAQWLESIRSLRPGMGGSGGARGNVQGEGQGVSGAGTTGRELERYSAEDVTGFDPSAYGKEFGRGALSEFNTNLTGRLQTLENQSVGAGRLRTGFYDRDQGSVATRLGEDYNQKIAQQSGVFSGQRLEALRGGAQLRFGRASEMDANTLRAQEEANRMTTSRSQLELERGGQENQFNLSVAQMGLSGAEYSDTAAADRARYLDEGGFRRATYLDDARSRRATTGLEAALGRESRSQDDYYRHAGRQDEYTSANREWASEDRRAQDTRDEIERLRYPQGRGFRGGGGSSTPKTRADASGYQQPV